MKENTKHLYSSASDVRNSFLSAMRKSNVAPVAIHDCGELINTSD